jgi:hypothetical protein
MAAVSAVLVLANLVLASFTLVGWHFLPVAEHIGLAIVGWATRYAAFFLFAATSRGSTGIV